MTYHYTDSIGDTIDAQPVQLASGPAVSIAVNDVAAWIPVDRIEEFIAGLRDTARQAAGGEPDHRHTAALHFMGTTTIPEQP